MELGSLVQYLIKKFINFFFVSFTTNFQLSPIKPRCTFFFRAYETQCLYQISLICILSHLVDMALGQRIKSPSFDLNAEPLDSLDVDKMCLLWKNDICSHCAQFFVKMSSNLFQTRVFTMFAVCSSPTPHIPIKLYTRRPMKKSNPQNTPHTLLIRHINLILPPPRLQQASHSQYVVSWRAREPERKRERECSQWMLTCNG